MAIKSHTIGRFVVTISYKRVTNVSEFSVF